MKAKSQKESLALLQQMCSKREYCLHDVYQKLMQWKAEKYFDDLSQLLMADKFIDEVRFCRAYIRDKARFSKWGMQKIKYSLYSKNISDTTIDEAMADCDLDFYSEMVREELSKKIKSLHKEEDEFKKKQKVLRFAQSRGYEMELINKVLNALGESKDLEC